MRAAIAATVILAVGSVYSVRHTPDEARVVSPRAAASPAITPSLDTLAKAKTDTAPTVTKSLTRNERVVPPAAAKQPQAAAREAAGPQPTVRRDAPRLADQSDLPKTVAGGVARPAAPPPPTVAVIDTVGARSATPRAPAAAGAGAAFAEQRRVAADTLTRRKISSNALQLSDVVATSSVDARAPQDRPTGVVRCYVIRSAPDWATGVPMRFALDDAPAFDTSLTRRVVRRVTDEGKVDGPIAGSWWQLSSNDGQLQVTLMRTAPANDVTLTMPRSARPPVRATITDRSRSQDVEVATSICSP